MASLKAYIARRALVAVVVFFGVLTLVFFLSRVVPADPAALYAGAHPRPEIVERIREELGLNRPLYEQYVDYMARFLSGDWGVSYRTHRPVFDDVVDALKASLELVTFAFLIGVAAGIGLGAVSALRAGGVVDNVVRLVAVTGVSFPPFFLGLLLQLVFSYWLGVLPAGSRISEEYTIMGEFEPVTGFYTVDALLLGRLDIFLDVLAHMVLPGVVLAAYPTALVARMTRAMMLEVLQEQYVVAARAWGVPERVVLTRYVLRNSLAPSVTVLAMSFSYTLVNAFLVEIIFAWPGLGSYAARAILSMDYPAILGSVVIGTIFYLVANTVADIVQAVLDPRVRLRW